MLINDIAHNLYRCTQCCLIIIYIFREICPLFCWFKCKPREMWRSQILKSNLDPASGCLFFKLNRFTLEIIFHRTTLCVCVSLRLMTLERDGKRASNENTIKGICKNGSLLFQHFQRALAFLLQPPSKKSSSQLPFFLGSIWSESKPFFFSLFFFFFFFPDLVIVTKLQCRNLHVDLDL